jgi:hypothetical protein
MVHHLHERIGEGAVVRSDDVEGNTVIGTAELEGRTYKFRVQMTNSGDVTGSEIEPVD